LHHLPAAQIERVVDGLRRRGLVEDEEPARLVRLLEPIAALLLAAQA
jgi:hypothetical protein